MANFHCFSKSVDLGWVITRSSYKIFFSRCSYHSEHFSYLLFFLKIITSRPTDDWRWLPPYLMIFWWKSFLFGFLYQNSLFLDQKKNKFSIFPKIVKKSFWHKIYLTKSLSHHVLRFSSLIWHIKRLKKKALWIWTCHSN